MPSELHTLQRALRLSEGQFSLLLARCAYRSLRNTLLAELSKDERLSLHLVSIPADTRNLLELLQNAVASIEPTEPMPGLLVTGLEQVENLEHLFASTNQLRDEFPRLLPCPLVLWVTDAALQCLIRVAPDFESWGTTIEFAWDDAQLLDFIRQKADTLLADWLAPEQVLPSQPLMPRYDPSQLAELQTAQKHLSVQGVQIPSCVQASLDLLRACDAPSGSEAAQQAYQSSLALWQQHADKPLNQAVCLILLAFNQQTRAQRQPRLRDTAWQQATQSLQQALELFVQAQREDLQAKFINALGQVLLLRLRMIVGKPQPDLLHALETLAQTALVLHQQQPQRLAQAQALWAEVQLRRGAQALLPSKSLVGLCDERDQAWFELLQAKQAAAFQSKEHQAHAHRALQHLQTALSLIEPHTDGYLYLRLLQTQHQVYFELQDYLAAFRVKLRQYDLEQQLDLRAFNGAGRLRSGVNWESSLDISGRIQDVQHLLARMERDDQPLTIVYGPSGVGKSSLIQAGLVSSLKQTRIHARPLQPILQTVYTDWIKELLQALQAQAQPRLPLYSRTLRHTSTEAQISRIIQQLRQLTARNYLVVLIFEQFEEFFFACPEPAQRRVFYQFLQTCLDLPDVKVILALREDYLHHLLECNARLVELSAINNNILDKNILYYLGNFSCEQAHTVIQNLTQNTLFQLEDDLIAALLEDFAAGGDGVRPIELQIVGNQLQHENIRSLEAYRAHGPKTALVERYVQTVVQDCGPEHEQLASRVLYLLTDEDNTRPLKTRAELSTILEPDETALGVVLAILTQSRLVFVHPGDPSPYYQLEHDYLVPFIRRQQSEDLQAQLEDEKLRRHHSEAKLNRVIQRLHTSSYFVSIFIALLGLAVGAWVTQTATEAKSKIQSLTVKRLWRSHQQLDALLVGLQQAQLLDSWQGHLLPQYDRYTALLSLQEVMQGITERNRLEAHRRRVLSVSYSPDGKHLASTSNDGQTLIWNTHGKLLARLAHIQAFRPPVPLQDTEQQTYELSIWDASFHPDGRTLAVAVNLKHRQTSTDEVDHSIELWDLQCVTDDACESTLSHSLQGHTGMIYSLDFSPDGQWLASSDDKHSIRLWTAKGEFIRELNGHTAPVHRVIFSPDSQRLLSVSDDKTLRLWSLDGTLLKVLKGHEDWVLNAAFSPDGQYIASVGRDGVRIWSLLTGQQRQPAYSKAQRHEDYVWGVAFSADGQWLATAGLDKVIKIWRFRPSQPIPLQLVNTLPGHQRGVMNLAFNPQRPAQLASAGLDNLVRLWQVEPARYNLLRGSESFAGKADEPIFTHLAFSPDSQLLATGSQEGEVILWDNRGRRYSTLQHREPLRKAHTGAITALTFSPDGAYLVSADYRGDIFLWDRQGRLRNTLAGHQSSVRQLSFSPDGAVLMSAGLDGVIRVWRGDGEEMDTLPGYAAAFNPTGTYLAIAPWDGLIRLLYLDGTQAYSLSNPTRSNTQIRFSPDGQLLFSASWQGDIDIWGHQGQHVAHVKRTARNINLPQDRNADFSISPDSRLFAIGQADGEVQLWSIAGTLIRSLHAHQGAVTQVRFSPDGQLLASAGVDQTIYLWRRDGRLLASFQEHGDLILDLRFSPDGRLLASTSMDKTVRLWSLDFAVDKLRARGCSWGRDYLIHSQTAWDVDKQVCD